MCRVQYCTEINVNKVTCHKMFLKLSRHFYTSYLWRCYFRNADKLGTIKQYTRTSTCYVIAMVKFNKYSMPLASN
jgi:hypothetical protein